MTPHVRAKIRNRNRLRQTIHQNHQEWIDACREANEAIKEAKTESWENILQESCELSESCAPLLMSELQSVIKKMKSKAAAGTDNIPPLFLKSLGPLALQELLSIFNSSFSLTHCPQIWRVATIIPLLIAGKSPSEVSSFRPISLTSCIAKLPEPILADRLYYIAETNNMFSQFQAGFLKVGAVKIRSPG